MTGPGSPERCAPAQCRAQPAGPCAATLSGAGSLHSHPGGRGGCLAPPGICSPLGAGQSRLARGAALPKTTTPRRPSKGRGNVVDTASATPVWIHCQCQQLLSLRSLHLLQGYRLGYLILIRTDSALLSYHHSSSQLTHSRGHAKSLLKKKLSEDFGTRKFQPEKPPLK